MSSLTVGSLFSGIGGLELGLERAGMRVLWQVEKDEYARRVLARHWPRVPCYDDVRAVHNRDDGGLGRLAPVDVLCGGFPCQDISAAGKRVGIDGERSGLWGEFARLIRELRPRYILVENVSALLVRGMGRVLGDLAASGYDAEWDCIPAAAVGAPHRRDRVFVVAYARDGRVPFGAWPTGRPSWQRATERRKPRRDGPLGDVADADGGRREVVGEPESQGQHGAHGHVFDGRGPVREFAHTTGAEHWAIEPDVGRVAHGVSARVDRLRCLGNAVVPQVAEVLGRLIVSHAREAA